MKDQQLKQLIKQANEQRKQSLLSQLPTDLKGSLISRCGSVSKAAQVLGIDHSQLYRFLSGKEELSNTNLNNVIDLLQGVTDVPQTTSSPIQ